MQIQLAGKIALVTGAGAGIGQGIALTLAATGATVLVNDKDVASANATVAQVEAQGGKAQVLVADISDEHAVLQLFAEIAHTHDALHVLVNNAGFNLFKGIADTTPTEWDQIFAIDLRGLYLVTRAALPLLQTARGASVINIASVHAQLTVANITAYAAAKARIFGLQGLMVLNRDDASVMNMLPAPTRVKLQRPLERTHTTFGTDMPRRPGDFGLEEVNGMVWLVRALEADETRKKRRDAVEELHIQRLMPADALRIRGRHNAANALAALALCAAAGCALAPILFGLREYRGEPHRVEPIGILNGVEFFDDSKGTNVGATVAALQGLGAERKLVLILGGEGKGQDFAPLAGPVARFTRAVVLIGRDAADIAAALQDTGVPLIHAVTMQDAVAQANQRAHAGDAVLMSPACASFDMFDNYAHRAQVFCTAVQDLALASGTQLEALA